MGNLVNLQFYLIGDRRDQKTLERLRAERQAKIDELKEKTNYYSTQQLIQVIIENQLLVSSNFLISPVPEFYLNFLLLLMLLKHEVNLPDTYCCKKYYIFVLLFVFPISVSHL